MLEAPKLGGTEALAKRFLNFLFRVPDAPTNGWVAISGYDEPDFITEFFPIDHLHKAAAYACELSANNIDAYVRCSLLGARPIEGRGRRIDTIGSGVLWVDIYKDVDAALVRLKAWDYPPTWINHSGHGIHAYWRLHRFDGSLDRIEGANRWLAQQHGGDHCWDVSRVLRIPGTTNYKDKPLVVSQVYSSAVTYGLTDFPQVPVDSDRNVKTALVKEPLPKFFLDRLSSDLRERIVTGGPTPATDRSLNDWHIVQALRRQGSSPAHCLAVLTHPEWFSGSKGRDNVSYAKYTVNAAFEAHTKYDSLGELIHAIRYADDPQKPRVLDSGELVTPAFNFLQSCGYRFLNTGDLAYLASPSGSVMPLGDAQEFRTWLTCLLYTSPSPRDS